MLQIPVGPGGVCYGLLLVKGAVTHPDFGECSGLCDTEKCCIYVSDLGPPAKRLKIFAHELAHAVRAECDPNPQALIDEETHCELAAMGTLLPPRIMAMVCVYLTCGRVPLDIVILPGYHEPIPIFREPLN